MERPPRCDSSAEPFLMLIFMTGRGAVRAPLEATPRARLMSPPLSKLIRGLALLPRRGRGRARRSTTSTHHSPRATPAPGRTTSHRPLTQPRPPHPSSDTRTPRNRSRLKPTEHRVRSTEGRREPGGLLESSVPPTSADQLERRRARSAPRHREAASIQRHGAGSAAGTEPTQVGAPLSQAAASSHP
jgi:hypothetical protein